MKLKPESVVQSLFHQLVPFFSNQRITEGTFSNAKIGEVLASDADLGFNSEVVFSLSSDDGRREGNPIKINPLDGVVYVNGTLNREKTPQIDLTVIAADGGLAGFDDPDFVPNLSQANLTVYILDANDNEPKFHNYDRLRRKKQKDGTESINR